MWKLTWFYYFHLVFRDFGVRESPFNVLFVIYLYIETQYCILGFGFWFIYYEPEAAYYFFSPQKEWKSSEQILTA